jgi:hypothetical protein
MGVGHLIRVDVTRNDAPEVEVLVSRLALCEVVV